MRMRARVIATPVSPAIVVNITIVWLCSMAKNEERTQDDQNQDLDLSLCIICIIHSMSSILVKTTFYMTYILHYRGNVW